MLQHPNASHPWWLRAAKALAVGYIVASQVLVDVAGWSYMAFGLGVSLAGLIAAGSLFGVWQPEVRKWTRVPIVFLCYCLLRSFSGVKDSHPWEAFASLLSAFLGGISIAAALEAGVRFRSLVYGLLASNVLQIAIILLGIGPEPPPGADTFRYAGITGNANELALQLTLGACLIWLMPKRAGLVPCLCAFGFVAFAVAATGSRKAILIAVFFIALVVVHALEKAPKKRRGLLGALAIVGLCLMGLCLAPRIAEQARDILAVQRSLDYEDHSFQTRANLVEEGLRLWEAAPLLGHGLDAFRGLASEDTYAHNNYVELLCDLGLLGTLLFYAIHAQALICASHLHKSLRLCCRVFLLLMLAADMGYVSYDRKQSVMILMVLLAVTTGSKYAVREAEPSTPRGAAHGMGQGRGHGARLLKRIKPRPRRFVLGG